MPAFVGRSYRGEGDAPAMHRLLGDCEPEASYDFHVHDLPEEPERNTCLWEDPDGSLAAMAAFYSPSWLLFVLHPQNADALIEAQVIDWAEVRGCADEQEASGSIKLRSHARENDGRRVEMLTRHGFDPEGGCALRMERPLVEPIPNPQLPPGFTIRPFDGTQDAPAWADLWNDMGTGHSMSVEQCLAWRKPPDIVPELDLIAVAPDGTFAGYCMCAISQAENEHTGCQDGWTDPIGTRPAFRRRGVARAVVLTALSGLRSRGCTRALLGVDGANCGAIQFYEACGYRTLYRKRTYAKEITCG